MDAIKNVELLFRAPEPTDLSLIYKWENDLDLWRYGGSLSPYSRNKLAKFIDNSGDDIFEHRQMRLMIELKETGDTVGCFDLFNFDPIHSRIELGFLIDKKWCNLGIATSMLQLAKEYVFELLDIHQLYAYVHENNSHSLHLFEKAGFHQIGVLKDWFKFRNQYEPVVIVQCINPLQNKATELF